MVSDTVSESGLSLKVERVGFGIYAIRCLLCNEIIARVTKPPLPDLPALTPEEAVNEVKRHMARRHKLKEYAISGEQLARLLSR